MDLKSIMRNVTPSFTVMALGLVGAYFVYNTYFSDRVATGFASFEPAAGQVSTIEGVDEMNDEIVLEEEEDKDIMEEIESGIKSLN